MTEYLLVPPIAFLIYLVLGAILSGIGRGLAGSPRPTALKSSTYASGEAPPTQTAAPGYGRFFVIALFFAVLHLGVLVLGSGGISMVARIYLGGLLLVLLVLTWE